MKRSWLQCNWSRKPSWVCLLWQLNQVVKWLIAALNSYLFHCHVTHWFDKSTHADYQSRWVRSGKVMSIIGKFVKKNWFPYPNPVLKVLLLKLNTFMPSGSFVGNGKSGCVTELRSFYSTASNLMARPNSMWMWSSVPIESHEGPTLYITTLVVPIKGAWDQNHALPK